MSLRSLVLILSVAAMAAPAYGAAGNAEAGRQLVTKSCTACHAPNASTFATDGAPPLSFISKDNKERPAWIRGWLMDPHPPMPGIMLSRQQIDDIIAYLNSLPVK